MNCAVLASGIIRGLKECSATDRSIDSSVIVRMEGTNVEEGKALLQASGLPIAIVDSLEEGAKQAVFAAAGGRDNGLDR